jgi:protein kinase-like protein
VSEVIGPYRIERELGRGGMGVVYAGVHQELGRRAAIKVLLDPKVGGERFMRECEGMARLTHPGIVRTYEAGVHQGCPFLAMELVEGRSLKDVLATSGPWPSRRAAELGVALCDAMAHVHAGGLLHRDLKPENVLIDNAGQARITDFGLVRGVGGQSLTATGTMVGTPSFMPPEQAEGEKKKLGPPADVYGLGATLFAVLTGVPPFQGPSPYAIVNQVFNTPAPAPSSLQSDVDPALEGVILRCLEKEPVDRYADAQALGDVLRSYLAGELQAPRRAGKLLVAGLLTLLLGGLAVGGALLSSRAEEATPKVDPEAVRAAWLEARGDASKLEAWLGEHASHADVDMVKGARQELAGLTWLEVREIGSTEDAPDPGDPERLRRYRGVATWLRDHGDYAEERSRRDAEGRLRLWRPAGPPPILAFLPGETRPASKRYRNREPFVAQGGRLLTLGTHPLLQAWDLEAGPREVRLEAEAKYSLRGAAQAGDEVLVLIGQELVRLAADTLETRGRVPLGTLHGVGAVALPGEKVLVFGDLKPGGGWSLVPRQPWPSAEAPQPNREAANVRAGLYDPERGEVFLTGGSSDSGARNYFLNRYRYAEGQLEFVEGAELTSAGYHLRLLPGGRVLVGLNRTYAVIFAAGDLEGGPLKLSLTNVEASLLLDGLGYQCLGSLAVPEGGLLLSCDSYQKRENGWLAYFDPKQLASSGTKPVLPRWIAPLPFRPRSMIASQDGTLIYLGTADGYVAVLPRFELR